MKKFYLFFVVFCYSFIAFSQNILQGQILDKNTKETLIGANLLIKGTSIGTATDFNGKFEIKTSERFPITIIISYLGYETKEVVFQKNKENQTIYISTNSKTLKEIKIVDTRLTEKQKESPLTVEAMDIIAIKETPSANFYDGLGSLKGVDISAVSLGFKVINTRGFNSSSPVRSLQIIDGVDNQAPGLNFSLGNFLGASELDVMKVEIIQGANSAYYGPNAFNGVISMTTKSPFIKPGLSVSYKFGSRNLFENAFRLAEVFKGKDGEDKFAYKINFSYMQAYDWEANNMNKVDDSNTDPNNPGGYDAVNRYGDEDTDGNLNDMTTSNNLNYIQYPGLGKFHRTGYMEKDIVDYNTKNLKAATALHYKLSENTEFIYSFNYGTGTTVYQGENRYSLKGIQFFQNRIEIVQKDKFFIRLYRSKEDAGASYDAVFTALKLQELSGKNTDWYTQYKNTFRNKFNWQDVNWSIPNIIGYGGNPPQAIWSFMGDTILIEDWYELSDSVLLANTNTIIAAHDETRAIADWNRLEPGTDEFYQAIQDITSKTSFLEGGTGFYDKSALNHLQYEYVFTPNFGKIILGSNFRIYQPNSKGTIFIDTNNIPIINKEFGLYSGIEKNILGEVFKINSTIRLDKNDNFNFLFSPAFSAVYKPTEKDIFRFSLSSAIRNPTLADQYLYYNAGRAILIGNISGHGSKYRDENLVTVESLSNYYETLPLLKEKLDFFSIDPIRPEKNKSVELGYRTTLFDKLYIDANYYFSRYTDFIGYKVGVKFVAKEDISQGTYFIYPTTIQAYRIAANAENKVFTQGASIGLSYFLHPTLTINGNYSWNKLDEKGTNDPIIPAYNTPEHKFNIGLVGRDLHFSNHFSFLRNYGYSINYKWIQGYLYEGSPQFTGYIPSYGLIDMQLSKDLPKRKSSIKAGVSNLLNNQHFEVYGGPFIGRFYYCSINIEVE